jgi:hypothetical protein
MLELPHSAAAQQTPPPLVERLEVHEDRVPSDWDRWVQLLGGGPFHCAAWAHYRSEGSHKRALFCVWFDGESSEPAAVALAIESVLPGPVRARSVEFDAPPATRLAPSQLLPALERWLRSQPALADVWLGSFDAERAWLDGTGPVTRVELRVEPASEDELFARMRTLARRSVRRARRSGIEIDADSASLGEFVDLYGGTLARLRRAKGSSTVLVDPEGFAQRLALLREADTAKLVMALEAGVPVAGAVFTVFGHRAFYLIGASNARGRSTGAMTAVLHRAIRDFSAADFRCVNLGGVSAGARLPSSIDHGLYEFKRGLGATAHECHDARIVLRPVRHRLIAGMRGVRSTLLRHAR